MQEKCALPLVFRDFHSYVDREPTDLEQYGAESGLVSNGE